MSSHLLNPANTNSGAARREMVVVVDDDVHILNALRMWLELQNMDVACYTDGESLLRDIQPLQGALTLRTTPGQPVAQPLMAVILDINLPGIHGIELARTLRQLSASIPMVIISALREDERRRYGAAPEGVRCLQKPFELEALEAALFPTPGDHQHARIR